MSGRNNFLKNIIVCDLENTLSNATHRMHLLKKDNIKFQKEFVNDPVNQNIANFISSWYNNNYNISIVILSAKRDTYKKDAELWLKKNEIVFDQLIMQKEKDKRTPPEFKRDYIKDNRNKILFALDDVGKTCAMIAEHNIPVLRITQENQIEI